MSSPAPLPPADSTEPSTGPWWSKTLRLVAGTPWLAVALLAAYLVVYERPRTDALLERLHASHREAERDRQATAVTELRALRSDNARELRAQREVETRHIDRLIEAGNRNTDKVIAELRAIRVARDAERECVMWCGCGLVP